MKKVLTILAAIILLLSLCIGVSGCNSKSSIDNELLGSWKYNGLDVLANIDAYVWTFQSNGMVKEETRKVVGIGPIEYKYSAENGKLTIYRPNYVQGKVVYEGHNYTYQFGTANGKPVILVEDQKDKSQTVLYKN